MRPEVYTNLGLLLITSSSPTEIFSHIFYNLTNNWDTWVVQSIKQPTLISTQVIIAGPRDRASVRLCAGHEACFKFSLPLFPPPPTHTRTYVHALSLSLKRQKMTDHSSDWIPAVMEEIKIRIT